MLERFYPDTYYINVYEDLKRKDGGNSYYNYLIESPRNIELMNGSRYTKKSELKKNIDTQMNGIVDINEFTATENDFGYIYERYVKWLDEDGFNYEIGTKDDYTDHEKFTVEVSFYEDVWEIFSKLKD